MTSPHDPPIERFFAYLDGEMDADERAAFEHDLAASDEMREEFEAFRSTLDLLHEARTVEPPPDLTLAVQARIRRRSRGRFFTTHHAPRYQIEVMVLLFGLVLGGIVLVTGGGPFRLFELPPPTPLASPDADAPDDDATGEPGTEPSPSDDDVGGATPGGGARLLPGAQQEWANATRIEPAWFISTDLDLDALHATARQRAGREQTTRYDDRIVVEVDARRGSAMLERLAELGTARRENVERDRPGPTRITLLPRGADGVPASPVAP